MGVYKKQPKKISRLIISDIEKLMFYYRQKYITVFYGFIRCNKVLTKYKNKFVFLKPGESYTDTYNLIGFKLLKGSFTFYVRPHLPPYVYTAPIWDSHQSQYAERKVLLPQIVGGYTLYSGNFYSNKITITF